MKAASCHRADRRGSRTGTSLLVTLYGDNTHSARCSFVGVGSYNLGREYGTTGAEDCSGTEEGEIRRNGRHDR